jgi:predicted TPR repeat methyltransferase
MDSVVRDRVRRLAPELLRGLDGRIEVLGAVWADVPDAPAPARAGTAPVDHVVAAGALWDAVDLDGVLTELAPRLADDGLLHFLEPTVDRHRGPTLARLRHDITECLWESGYSVIEVRRFDVRGEWGIPWPFVRGRARRSRGPAQ